MSEWRPPSGYSQVKGESTVSEAEVEDGGNSIVLRVPRGIKLSSLARIERESGLVYDKEGRAFRMVPLGPEQLMDMEVYVSHGGKGYKPAGVLPHAYAVVEDVVIEQPVRRAQEDVPIPQPEGMRMRFKPYGYGPDAPSMEGEDAKAPNGESQHDSPHTDTAHKAKRSKESGKHHRDKGTDKKVKREKRKRSM